MVSLLSVVVSCVENSVQRTFKKRTEEAAGVSGGIDPTQFILVCAGKGSQQSFY
jgi:hypothetical protein